MHLKQSVLSASLLAAFSLSAHAADLAQQPVEPAPPIVEPFTWTGFYVGVNAGASISDSSVRNELGGAFLTSPDVAAYQQQYRGKLDDSKTGFTGGGLVGYNWQYSNFVFGAEADINYQDHKSSSRTVYDLTTPFDGTEDRRLDFQSNWFGTVRARAGYAFDTLLIYATGGLAYGEVKASGSQIENGGNYDWSGSTSKTKTGWVAGGGVEYALMPQWIIGAEYLHVDLGSTSFAMPDLAGSDYSMRGKVEAKFDIVRATLKYKF